MTQQPGSPGAAPAPTGGRRVLVVEDDPLIAGLLERFLKAIGCDVALAPDGQAGLDAALADGYDLVITDNNMPRLRGVAMVAAIKAVIPRQPVIMLQGDRDLEDAPAAGVDLLLHKPFSLVQLASAVATLLGPPAPPPASAPRPRPAPAGC